MLAVTGAHGFIGREVIRRLLDDRRFVKILALDVRAPALQHDKLRHLRVDLTMPAADVALGQILTEEGADTLLHAAFLSQPSHDPAWAHELEAIGTMHALSAASSAKVSRVVLWSQTLVYGAGPQNPNFLAEDRPLYEGSRPGFIADKVEAERQARAFVRECPEASLAILRTAPILGPSVKSFAARFLSRPLCPSLLGFDPLMQFVHEEDAIDAFLRALLLDVRGAFNIVGPGVLPYSTVLAMLGRLPLPLPRLLAYPLGRALWALQASAAPPELLDFLCYLCVADGARARRELGFSPRHDIRAILDDFAGVGGAPAGRRPGREPAVVEVRP